MDRKGILVTGGTGFLGSYILKYLVAYGYTDIYAIKRKSSSLDLVNNLAGKVNWVDCDIMDMLGMEDLLKEVNYVIHSAAIISFVKKEIPLMMQVNVKGTEQLVNLSLSNDIKRFIQISSISALGREKEGQVLNEKNSWVKSKYTTNYAISKFLAEQECFRAHAEGLNMAILTPSLILGAGLWNSGSTNIFKKVDEGLSFYTSGGTGIVDVRDVAILTIKLLESEINGERVIANAANVSFKDLLSEISVLLEKKAPTKKLGPFLQGLAWRLEYLKSILKNESPIITRETMRQTAATFYFENEKSIKALGHNYLSWKDTIKDSVDAYQNFKKNGEIQSLKILL
jgi:nucleoside-diphosphate-sugar epimerase